MSTEEGGEGGGDPECTGPEQFPERSPWEEPTCSHGARVNYIKHVSAALRNSAVPHDCVFSSPAFVASGTLKRTEISRDVGFDLHGYLL